MKLYLNSSKDVPDNAMHNPFSKTCKKMKAILVKKINKKRMNPINNKIQNKKNKMII